MSRFNEGDGENPISYMWEANMQRIFDGKRGQKLLREFIDALLALPRRRLVADVAGTKEGDVCAIGALAKKRGVDFSDLIDLEARNIDQEDMIKLGEKMGLGFMLAWELGAQNDLTCVPLYVEKHYVTLDVPIQEERSWRKQPNFTIHATAFGELRGYSPEDRWQHLYTWASSKIRWNLPVPVTA